MDLHTNTPTAQRTIYQVSELNTMVRELLGQSFGLMWIEGEISNLARPRSGHMYFSLKDNNAQVRCALFRNKSRFLKFQPGDGDQVLVRARVGLYAARGDYQLIVEHMEPAGAGALQRAFDALKAKLDAEGLFAEDRKRRLPAVPKRIGVITSATGAALRDVLSVLSRRYPLGAVRVYPVPVQGTAAPAAIVKALALASHRGDCDVLLLTRGGGSLEDLQPFNDESVARAVAACSIPVIAGVGHEVDITICDFVADVRAPTPSAAAELVCPDMTAWQRQLDHGLQRLSTTLSKRLHSLDEYCQGLDNRLARQHPKRSLEEGMQRIDDAETRLIRASDLRLRLARQSQGQLQARLLRASPTQRIDRVKTQHDELARRLAEAARRIIHESRQRTHVAARTLHTASPLQTLERGYAITRDAHGQVLRDADDTKSGDQISVTLRRGELDCRVTGTSKKTSFGSAG